MYSLSEVLHADSEYIQGLWRRGTHMKWHHQRHPETFFLRRLECCRSCCSWHCYDLQQVRSQGYLFHSHLGECKSDGPNCWFLFVFLLFGSGKWSKKVSAAEAWEVLTTSIYFAELQAWTKFELAGGYLEEGRNVVAGNNALTEKKLQNLPPLNIFDNRILLSINSWGICGGDFQDIWLKFDNKVIFDKIWTQNPYLTSKLLR